MLASNGPVHDFIRSRASADRMIRKWGMQAVLRRHGIPDRWIWTVNSQFTPAERLTLHVTPVDKKYIVSAIDLDIPPSMELGDALVTYLQPIVNIIAPVQDQLLRFVTPPYRLSPAEVDVLWILHVRA